MEVRNAILTENLLGWQSFSLKRGNLGQFFPLQFVNFLLELFRVQFFPFELIIYLKAGNIVARVAKVKMRFESSHERGENSNRESEILMSRLEWLVYIQKLLVYNY